jgi:hypothetical protein
VGEWLSNGFTMHGVFSLVFNDFTTHGVSNGFTMHGMSNGFTMHGLFRRSGWPLG